MLSRSTVAHATSTFFTFGILAGVAWWGHATGWNLTVGKVEPVGEHAGYWCGEHGVPEVECLLCRKSFAREMQAKEPAAQVATDEEIRFAQLSSPEILKISQISTAAVSEALVEPTLSVPGETTFDATRVSRVISRLPGSVREVCKQVGDRVAPGDLLVVVESADVGRLKSELMRALAEHEHAQAVAARVRVLVTSGSRSASEAQESETRLRVAQIALFAAEQGLLNLGFTLTATELAGLDAPTLAERLRHLGLPAPRTDTSANLLPIRATQAGIITALDVTPGESIESGTQLAVLADLTRLWLSLAVDPTQAALIQPGHTVRFATAGMTIPGVITVVSAAADDATRLVQVQAMIDNPDGRLRAHQVGEATVVLGTPQTRLIVPPSAVEYDGPQAYVFVQRTPTIFRGLPVEVLATVPAGVAISRVLPGDVIAISGTAVLKGNLFQEKFGPGCCAPE